MLSFLIDQAGYFVIWYALALVVIILFLYILNSQRKKNIAVFLLSVYMVVMIAHLSFIHVGITEFRPALLKQDNYLSNYLAYMFLHDEDFLLPLKPGYVYTPKPSKGESHWWSFDWSSDGFLDSVWSLKWDLFMAIAMFVFLMFIFSKREGKTVRWKWRKDYGFGIAIILGVLYIILRPSVDFEVSKFVRFSLSIVWIGINYPRFIRMCKTKQCMPILDPITREPTDKHNKDMLFANGIVSYFLIIMTPAVLLIFPSIIVDFNIPLLVRLIIVAIGVFIAHMWIKTVVFAGAWDKMIAIMLFGLSVLIAIFPGLIFYLIFMLACCKVAAIYQLPLTSRGVFEINRVPRIAGSLAQAIFFFTRQKADPNKTKIPLDFGPDGKPVFKTILIAGLNFTGWPMFMPFTRIIIFPDEIYEKNKFKIKDKLITASQACKFDTDKTTGIHIEKLPESNVDIDTTSEDAMTASEVTFTVSSYYLKYRNLSDYVFFSLEDREKIDEVIETAIQNVLKKITAKLSLSQVLKGEIITSKKYLYYLDDNSDKAITFFEAVRREVLEHTSYELTKIFMSDIDPDPEIAERQKKLEQAKYNVQIAKQKALEDAALAEGDLAKIKIVMDGITESLNNNDLAKLALEWDKIRRIAEGTNNTYIMSDSLTKNINDLLGAAAVPATTKIISGK